MVMRISRGQLVGLLLACISGLGLVGGVICFSHPHVAGSGSSGGGGFWTAFEMQVPDSWGYFLTVFLCVALGALGLFLFSWPFIKRHW